MAQPIREQILDNLVTTLEGVTVANGYEQNIRKVSRMTAPWMEISGAMPLAEILTDTETYEDEVINCYDCEMDAHILVYTDDTNDPGQALSYLEADIIKALMQDTTRGSLAHDTKIERIEREWNAENKRPSGVAEISLKIKYRIVRDDPYTKG